MVDVIKASQLREKTTQELQSMLLDLKQESMNLRFQRRMTEFKQTDKFRIIRRSYARIMTLLTERQRAIGPDAQ